MIIVVLDINRLINQNGLNVVCTHMQERSI